MQKQHALWQGLQPLGTALLFFFGAVLVSLGLGLIFFPAGLIAAGIFLLAAGLSSLLGADA